MFGGIWLLHTGIVMVLHENYKQQTIGKRIVVANWKMNGNAELCHTSILSLLAHPLHAPHNKPCRCTTEHTKVILCPPFVLLDKAYRVIDEHSDAIADSGYEVQLGAQDCSMHVSGAYTGDTNAKMLKECGCSYVIVGHSERRSIFHESIHNTTEKAQRAKESGLIPIICIGEPHDIRESGRTRGYLSAQLNELLKIIADWDHNEVVLAYEPVWAIGSGSTASTDMVSEVRTFLGTIVERQFYLLYGGSVTATNSYEIARTYPVDGVLVGGSSLKHEDFATICHNFGCIPKVY